MINLLSNTPVNRSRVWIGKIIKTSCFAILIFLALTSIDLIAKDVQIPKIPREFRGVWIATVSNIDWPSRPGLSVGDMKRELHTKIKSLYDSGFNAVIFQVRPACEVLYPSRLEPWSEVLTGTSGKPPADNFDPLKYAIDLSHAYGMEFHAWINPFRARHKSSKSPIASNHISRVAPKIVHKYSGYLWLDPGRTQAQNHTLNVIQEIIQNYDIDGIHLDDYFYPYIVTNKSGKKIEFPDWNTYTEYKKAGGTLGHHDWRRGCINRFVSSLYKRVKKLKPQIKVGISPFGIWRPNHPAGIKGKDSVLELWADSRKWLQEGWLDYCAPQLYWKLDSPGQPFAPLHKWWVMQNSQSRHIYPGLNLSNVGLQKWDIEEIINQVNATRKIPGSQGQIHFSSKYILPSHEQRAASHFKKSIYSSPALVPEMNWIPLKKQILDEPRATVRKSQQNGKQGLLIKWHGNTNKHLILKKVIHVHLGSRWKTYTVTKNQNEIFILDSSRSPISIIATQSVSRTHQLSPAAIFQF